MTVLFPDVEQLTVGFLRTAVQAVGGYSDVGGVVTFPETLPARFFRVRRAGGSRDTLVTDSPRVQYQAWGLTDTDSHDIAQQVRSALLFAFRGSVQAGVAVYNVVEVGGPVPIPDPDTGRPRYVGSVEIRLRGVQA